MPYDMSCNDLYKRFKAIFTPKQSIASTDFVIRNLTTERLTINQLRQYTSHSGIKLLDDALEPYSTLKSSHNGQAITKDLVEIKDQHTSKPSLQEQQLTAIYDVKSNYITLYETPDMKCWMKDFSDDTSIAALSIPGTHNSPTYHWALPSVRCQAVSPLEQLNNGIRFFDIRVQPHDLEHLYLVHGAFPISLTGAKKFRALLQDIEGFLVANPSETLIISVKREGTGKATDQQLADVIEKYYAQGWYTEPRIPNLGEVRGKIVLMRRFILSDRLRTEYPHGWALDAESWADNTPSCVHGQVCVQDFYEVLNTKLIPKKIEVSCAQFERAGALAYPIQGQGEASQIYLNFLTASNFFNFRCWPENIAAKLNPAITSFLCKQHDCGTNGDGGLGIVVCDWVGKNGNWDLVKCIVGMNSRRLMKERGYGWR